MIHESWKFQLSDKLHLNKIFPSYSETVYLLIIVKDVDLLMEFYIIFVTIICDRYVIPVTSLGFQIGKKLIFHTIHSLQSIPIFCAFVV